MAIGDPIESVADTIDGKVDEIIGIKPKEIVFDAISDLGPANIIHNATGLPKPGEVVKEIQEKLSPNKFVRSHKIL